MVPFKFMVGIKWLPFCRQHLKKHKKNTKIFVFWFKFYWSLFVRVQLTSHHWFRYWLGVAKVAGHYLNQWRPSSLKHICIIRPQHDELIDLMSISICQHDFFWQLEYVKRPIGTDVYFNLSTWFNHRLHIQHYNNAQQIFIMWMDFRMCLYLTGFPFRSIPSFLMPWLCKEPGHQPTWYWWCE